jgi:hypothetical protein
MIEIIFALLFVGYFVWSAGKILKLKRLLCYRDAAYFKAVTEHEGLTARFQSLRDEVAVKHKEVTATFNGLLAQVARMKAAQTNQAVN